jgi:predicted nucleic acid-binding Zn ribbon protein
MPVYTYRREDGTTFDYRQKFLDDPLTVDPDSGQRVTRVVQAAGIIFKGSGFYINDSKSSSKSTIGTPPPSKDSDAKPTDSKSDSKTEAKSEAKGEAASTSKPAEAPASKPEPKAAAAD